MVPKLIGITGKAGAGKDTLADALVLEYGADKYSFARPIKEALNAMFGWTMDQWDDRVWKEKVIPWLGKSPRQCAQTLGTEWGREVIHQELWVMLAEQRFIRHLDEYTYANETPPFVIPDLRFDNEAVMIKSQGGIVVEVRRGEAAPISAHKSEAGVQAALVDLVIVNDGSMQLYLERALQMLGETQ